MASGINTTSVLGLGLPSYITGARLVREQEGVMPQLVDKATLGEGVGTAWTEVDVSQLSDAQAIGEGFEFEDAEQIALSLRSATPTEIGKKIIITDRTKKRLDKKVLSQTGTLVGRTLQRKKSRDGITMLDGFSTSFGNGSTSLTTGYIRAAAAVIMGNSTEQGSGDLRTVHHAYQIKKLADALAVTGTYPMPSGISETVMRQGFKGITVDGVAIYTDNVTAPSSNAFKGGTFDKEAIVLVQGYNLYTEDERLPGRRATAMYTFDEYIYVERADSMGVEQNHDATQPSS